MTIKYHELISDNVYMIKLIAEMEGVISVLPNTILKLHTTRSWDFMGFTEPSYGWPSEEGEVIVGLIDTG